MHAVLVIPVRSASTISWIDTNPSDYAGARRDAAPASRSPPAEDDPDESFVRVGESGDPFRGELVPGARLEEFVPGEPHWSLAGAEVPSFDFPRIGSGAAADEREGEGKLPR